VDFLSVGLLCLLHVSPLAKAGTVVALAARRLAPRYPFFCAGLLISALTQCLLIYGWWSGGYRAYGQIWRVVMPFQMAATLAVSLEALWVLSRHFPKARNLATFMLLLGGLVALLTVIPASVALPSDALTAVRRHGKAGLWMVLAITRLFLEGVEPALRGNAKLHSTGILVALAGSVAGDVVLGLSGAYWVQAGGKVLLMGLPVAACWWWLQMRPAGESFTPTPGPTLEELDGEMERIQEEIRAYRKAAGGE